MSIYSKKIKPVLDPIEDKEDAEMSPYDKILSYLAHGKLDKALDLLIEQGIIMVWGLQRVGMDAEFNTAAFLKLSKGLWRMLG